jgi:hypothetical protein
MSKLLIALSLVGFVAACAPKPEPMPAPVTDEPVYTGKYK